MTAGNRLPVTRLITRHNQPTVARISNATNSQKGPTSRTGERITPEGFFEPGVDQTKVNGKQNPGKIIG